MAKFWNFVLFQLGWFACIIGAANHQVFWPVIITWVYLAIHIWRSDQASSEMGLMLKASIFGVSADSLISLSGFIVFDDAWPSHYLSPIWMWTLWALFASTINGSLSWLRGKPLLGAALGVIAGPLSYEAGIRMGAASWGPNGQIGGLIVLAVVWGMAVPVFLYWDRVRTASVENKS